VNIFSLKVRSSRKLIKLSAQLNELKIFSSHKCFLSFSISFSIWMCTALHCYLKCQEFSSHSPLTFKYPHPEITKIVRAFLIFYGKENFSSSQGCCFLSSLSFMHNLFFKYDNWHFLNFKIFCFFPSNWPDAKTHQQEKVCSLSLIRFCVPGYSIHFKKFWMLRCFQTWCWCWTWQRTASDLE
jgi:hypothetical protein